MDGVKQIEALQERRVSTYRMFDEALKAFVDGGDEAAYKTRAIESTAIFQEISYAVRAVESRLPPQRAAAVRRIQEAERDKLRITAQRHAFVVMHRAGECDDEVVRESERTFAENVRLLVGAINEGLEELREDALDDGDCGDLGDEVGAEEDGGPEVGVVRGIVGLFCDPLRQPAGTSALCRCGDTDFWHYTCGGFDDAGWGCTYRCCQMLCSNLRHSDSRIKQIPSIPEIQKRVGKVGLTGREAWIEPPDVAKFVAEEYGLRGEGDELKIVTDDDAASFSARIRKQFETQGCPVIIDDRVMSYVIAAVRKVAPNDEQVLILDPHVQEHVGAEVLLQPCPNQELTRRTGWASMKSFLMPRVWLVFFAHALGK